MKIEKSWHEQLREEISRPYIATLKAFLSREKEEGRLIYPEESLIFRAFAYTPFDAVKVVIVGQDPYHGKGQAHGLAFSVPPGMKPPPSLKNIFKEIAHDFGIPHNRRDDGCLISWAQQGVFLLNAILTVRAAEPRSHHKKGWEMFTDGVIDKLAQRSDPVVFLLWGKIAQDKGARLKGSHHLVLEAAHPSPYSAERFFGCGHFSKCNDFLKRHGKTPIEWF